MKKFRVTVNGNTYEVDVEELSAGGAKTLAPKPATENKVVETVAPAGPGAIKIEAPMQGKVIDVKVSEGTKVKAGDVILILEAMKMENDVVAPSDGVIASINIANGQAINAGDVIATLN